MEDEVKVGEYVRLENGEIFKIDENTVNYYNKNKEFITNDIVKHSFDIIDLLKVEDFVEMSYRGIVFRKILTQDDLIELKMRNYELLEIVTKEQMEARSFKVERED